MQIIDYIRNRIRIVWVKIVGLFTKNLSRKLLSLFIAAIIWVIAVNISNPEVTVEQTVSISVNYADALEDANKTYTLETTTAKVSYTIRSENRSLVSAGDFNAYVNLIDYSVTGAVPIYVDVDPSVSDYVSNVTVRPLVVRVNTEDMIEASFNIVASIEGSAAEGKAVGDLSLSSNQLTLYGPGSDIGRVASCGIVIQVNYADSDISGIAEPVFYDSVGNVVTLGDRTVVRETISYTLPIYNTKRCAVLAGYSGTPASGYTVSSVTCDPASLVIYGPDELLDSYNNITIPDSLINVSSATGNVAVLIDAGTYLPDGLKPVESGDVSIVANVVRASTLPQSSRVETTETDQTSDSTQILGSSEATDTNQTETHTETHSETHASESHESTESFSTHETSDTETSTSQSHSESTRGESDSSPVERTETVSQDS